MMMAKYMYIKYIMFNRFSTDHECDKRTDGHRLTVCLRSSGIN